MARDTKETFKLINDSAKAGDEATPGERAIALGLCAIASALTECADELDNTRRHVVGALDDIRHSIEEK